MGQKVNPTGMRLGITEHWRSNWYAKGVCFSNYLKEDFKIRSIVKKHLSGAFVSKVVIDRPAKNVIVTVHSARPGIIIGKKGNGVDVLRDILSSALGVSVHIKVEEIKKPDLDAVLLAASVAQQLERRAAFRKVIKKAVQNAIRQGALGAKVSVAGRLAGAEIARVEWHKEGMVPLHTFRADVSYGVCEAKTTYGIIGVKVWVFRKEIREKVGFSDVKQKQSDTE